MSCELSVLYFRSIYCAVRLLCPLRMPRTECMCISCVVCVCGVTIVLLLCVTCVLLVFPALYVFRIFVCVYKFVFGSYFQCVSIFMCNLLDMCRCVLVYMRVYFLIVYVFVDL